MVHDLTKPLTKAELALAARNLEKHSVPIMADPKYYPNHVLVHPDRERAAPVDRFGNRVTDKKGHYKHIVSMADLHDDEGNPYPIVPLFADRMKAGSHGRDGGPGFPYDPRWYGHWSWASLKGSHGKEGNLGGLAQQYVKLLERHPKGYVGLVTVGAHGASVGNAQFIQELREHVLPRLDTSEKEGKFMDLVHSREFHKTLPMSERFRDPVDFFDQLGKPMATTLRQSAVDSMIGVNDWKVNVNREDYPSAKAHADAKRELRASNKKFVEELDMPGAVEKFNDYAHVPAGHGVSMIKVTPHFRDFDGSVGPNRVVGAGRSLERYLSHGGDPSKFHLERPGSPVYPGHFGGVGLGDLLHSVPLHGMIIHNKTGERSFENDQGAHVIRGADKPDGSPGGLVSARYGVMSTGPTFTIDPRAVADHVQKALILEVSPQHKKYLDEAYDSGYSDGEDTPMRNITAEDYDQMTPEDQARIQVQLSRHAPAHVQSHASMIEAAKETLSQYEKPEVQVRLLQAIRGVVKP